MNEEELANNPYGILTLEPLGEFVAGSYESFTLTYTAGIYGMDDLGGLKIFFRYACDQSPLQTVNPDKVGYITATASNGAHVSLYYALREGERPWYKMLRVRIEGKGLVKGETIKVNIGDTIAQSPGIRLQTFCEPNFEFRTEVDVFSTNVFTLLPSPTISIVSGKPESWKAFLPTLTSIDQEFELFIRAEDKWGNPSDKAEGLLILKSSQEIKGLPNKIEIKKGRKGHQITGLKIEKSNINKNVFNYNLVYVDIYDSNPVLLARTNPLIVKEGVQYNHYWGDMHGQSEETIGTNTAESYFKFAKDVAFLDVIGHQGNDFQITKSLWKLLNDLSEQFYHEDKFVTLFGYEYSANTALGGDRNVYFLKPYRQIHRSSHALIEDKSDLDTDCMTASELFDALHRDNPNADISVLVLAHVGGRYADILKYHDGRVENSIEIHSAWGTFEWLLFDAFENNYRVGIVANGDDHKGRPGVAYPGASKFGTYGGLTCFLSPNLSREAIFEALKKRHHYATTGKRIYLESNGILSQESNLYNKDPAIFPHQDNILEKVSSVEMGDIIGISDKVSVKLILQVAVVTNSPIERLEIFNGKEIISTIRPYLYYPDKPQGLGEALEIDLKSNFDLTKSTFIEGESKIRIRWEGAEFRARKRNTSWKGKANFHDNHILSFKSFNFWNRDETLLQFSPSELGWNTITSGNIQGFDVQLSEPKKGKIEFKSSQIDFTLPLQEVSIVDKVYNIGGVGKKVRIFRLPKNNSCDRFRFRCEIPLNPSKERDERIFVKVILEDGHQAWSSPMYFFTE
ncbi:MAG: DUF3604 domain-containing protein [Candidatus Lokiarchaeota archaeon]|nr:DUF3604 domain-containing protein [Candidatus Lokiarchaeota archaeon]MBD3342032.1 DUF3604 domain-containing protein [Candidatus Lokiarchaeota archaeon]